ncbi:MAG: DUF1963 domain-containing protein [Candidatus Sericytochromatia bacterium]
MSVLEDLQAKLKMAGLTRSVWLPLTEAGEKSRTESKFSGKAWLPVEENWPFCQNCQTPMQLMLQLNCADLPDEVQTIAGTGLLQLFYCVNTEPFCAIDCEAWYPFAKSVLARRVQPNGQGSVAHLPENAFPAQRIIAWKAGPEEYPSAEEAKDFLSEREADLSDDEYDLLLEEMGPASGEKLGGWPAWVQGVEYPHCPDCKVAMVVIFQLDSEQNLPHSWGDMGIGHLSVCQQHPDILAFGWAC